MAKLRPALFFHWENLPGFNKYLDFAEAVAFLSENGRDTEDFNVAMIEGTAPVAKLVNIREVTYTSTYAYRLFCLVGSTTVTFGGGTSTFGSTWMLRKGPRSP